jgi:hypothetical protein
MHGQGTYTDSTGWSYTGALERGRPTKGVLTEADGRRFTVTYAKTCKLICDNPKPRTKVGGKCGSAVLGLQPVRARRGSGRVRLVGRCGHMVFAVDMVALCVRVRG